MWEALLGSTYGSEQQSCLDIAVSLSSIASGRLPQIRPAVQHLRCFWHVTAYYDTPVHTFFLWLDTAVRTSPFLHISMVLKRLAFN